MKRRLPGWLATALVLAAGVPLTGQQAPVGAPSPPAPSPKYRELESKAQLEHGGKQAEALAQLAQLDFAEVQSAYAGNRALEWESALQRAHDHAAQAWTVFQEVAAAGKSDGMKNTEVSIEKVGYGLQDLARDARFRDRPPVEAEANYFADLRTHMLQVMFAPKKRVKNPEGP